MAGRASQHPAAAPPPSSHDTPPSLPPQTYSAGNPTEVPPTDLNAVAERCCNPIQKNYCVPKKKCCNALDGVHDIRRVTGAQALDRTSSDLADYLGYTDGAYRTKEDKLHNLLARKGIHATQTHHKTGIAVALRSRSGGGKGLACGGQWSCRG